MGSTFPMQQFYRPTPLTVDTSQAQKYFDEEDNSILDESILDHGGLDSGLEMSPPMADSRRDSFAVTSSLFSPKTEDWQAVDMQSVPSSNPVFDAPPHANNNNPFLRGLEHPHTHQPTPFGQPTTAWSMSTGSGACTPLQYDGLPASAVSYENVNGGALFQRTLQDGQTSPFGSSAPQMGMFSAINQSVPPSPQKDWLGQNQSMAKKMGPSGSPTIRSHNELRRGDGIRKKNARFDIPAERNLNNIDQLIAQSTDEQEIKELKQQKRLLRNRQAALDSRQRKKQHTERLEDEKKQFTTLITDMEEEMLDLKTRVEQLMREKQSYENYIETLTMDKEEMIRNHTIETGELRKKVSVLTDHVQRLEGTSAMAMPGANPHHNPYATTPYDNMEGMAMHHSSWDNVGMFGDFTSVEPQAQQPEIKQEPQAPGQQQLVKKGEIPFPGDMEKPSASNQGGLIFWLFLIGAFVISKGSAPGGIPRVSEDVRATSGALLESVLKDAGVGAAGASAVEALAPQPSGSAWSAPGSVPSADNTGMEGVTLLGQLGDSLTQPTPEQANEQLFGLSAAQYNGVVGAPQDFIPPPDRAGAAPSQGRRNLAEAMAAMRTSKQHSAAEVYSRSLLWDQIPSDVVRSFAKMVAESNNAQNEQQRNEATRT